MCVSGTSICFELWLNPSLAVCASQRVGSTGLPLTLCACSGKWGGGGGRERGGKKMKCVYVKSTFVCAVSVGSLSCCLCLNDAWINWTHADTVYV